jgi:hypothetical protein
MGALDLDDVPRCRVCGCTEEHGCPGGCCWVEDPEGGDLCSACAAHDEEGWPISTLLEDFAGARQELARAQASDDRVGEVLAAGRVMAIQLEGVVQDCSGCDGTGLTLVHDKQIDCPDCAQVRQAIHDWEVANGRYQASRVKKTGPSVAERLIRGIACHPASALEVGHG